jgi:cytochrome c oxidase subunit 2
VNTFGTEELLATGAVATVNESYVRESILNPQAKLVAGYQPLMPTFQGLVTEEQVMALIEHVKSLQTAGGRGEAPAAPPAAQETR